MEEVKVVGNSVHNAYSVLQGRSTGNQEKAQEFLNSMSRTQYTLRNRAESRQKARMKAKSRKMGAKPRPRIAS